MNDETNDLSQLRQKILKHQWKEAYQILSTLFERSLPQYTGFVVNQMVRSSLRFQSQYDLEWILSFAREITHFIEGAHTEIEPPSLPHEANGTFADAPFGVATLVGGAVEVWRSVSAIHDSGERAKLLVHALDRFILAEISDYWNNVYPEEIELREMFSDAETTTEGRKILSAVIDKEKLYRGIGFLKQPESIGYRSAKLLSIVDEIELMLNKQLSNF